MIAIIDSSYCEILANAGVNWGGFMFRRLFPPFGRVNSLVYIFCLGGRFCWTYLYLENMKGEKDMKKKLMIDEKEIDDCRDDFRIVVVAV